MRLLREIDFQNIYYYIRPTDEEKQSWDDVPENIKNTFDRLGIPEAERKFLAGVSAQYESEVVYHSIREDLEKQGVVFLAMDEGLKQYPELVQKYFATVIPPTDNKFVRIHSPRRPCGDPAAGLFPHQRGERWPVRAHPDHRRRGIERALYRGLHGAHLRQQQPPLGSGGAASPPGLQDPLHHDPELVEERLQPGHQASGGPRGRGRGVGRRQPRLTADHEVPGDLPDRASRPRGDPLGSPGGPWPTPGRRRQGRARRPGHDQHHRGPLHQQGRRTHLLSRPRQDP